MTCYIRDPETGAAVLIENKDVLKWEMFYDNAYFGMYAVRPIGDRGFGSAMLFHLDLKEEAERLMNYLNSLYIPA